jgi:hypothetical protein
MKTDQKRKLVESMQTHEKVGDFLLINVVDLNLSKSLSRPQNQHENNTTTQPAGAIASLRECVFDSELVKSVTVLLRTQAVSWIEQFVQLGGVQVLVANLSVILSQNRRPKPNTDFDEIEEQYIRCLKGLMNNKVRSSSEFLLFYRPC